jgi:ubiquinone/menaquinone biosynthesis C-methylase UbiE
MLDYYCRRAATYERVYLKPERQADIRAIEAALPALFAGRSVLEIAADTGWWTPHAARDAKRWLATDLNPETLDIARAKPLPACVELRVADAFSLAEIGDERFDAAFAGCWWSHLTWQQLPAWLDTLHARLAPGARVVMLDNSFVQTSSTPISRTDPEGNSYQQRMLDDGSTYEVVKNFPRPEQAIALLGRRAHSPRWTDRTHYWMLQYELD